MSLAHYLRYRRRYEVALWATLFTVQWLGNATVVWLDHSRAQLDRALWEPLLWEGSSLLVLAALLPLILAFDRRVPLRVHGLPSRLLAHVLFTIPFSLLHVTGMVAIRTVVYAGFGLDYDFGPWPRELMYEYLKDIRTYAGLLAIIYLYRFVLLRAQGEARLLDSPEDQPGQTRAEPVERLLIKMLGKEFLVNVADVEWMEASGNYVNLHVGPRCYPLRSTLSGLEQRLDPAHFSRMHRSFIVNLGQIDAIEPLESGDARIRLKSGAVVPLSRRYRAALRERLEP